MHVVSRRAALTIIAGSAALPLAPQPAFAQQAAITKDQILNDPDAPVGGNQKGDVTIVAFLDYNCPFCKKSAPDLERIVRDDGKIRLVYKDWPILRPTSIDGARLALAARYQGKYEVAHHALMGIPGYGIAKEKMRAALQASGIDMIRLDSDMAAHASDIDALIKRNMAQADALGLQGTPTFLVGPFMASTLDYQGFKQVVADARAKQAKR
jgi:protein-disulfide isomerase